jgi:hypothetical protein
MVKLDLPGLPIDCSPHRNTVQLTVDLGRRAWITFPSVAGFAGWAIGAFLEVHFAFWTLAFRVVLAYVAL